LRTIRKANGRKNAANRKTVGGSPNNNGVEGRREPECSVEVLLTPAISLLAPYFPLPALGPFRTLGRDLELVGEYQLIELLGTGDLRGGEVGRKIKVRARRTDVVGQRPGFLLLLLEPEVDELQCQLLVARPYGYRDGGEQRDGAFRRDDEVDRPAGVLVELCSSTPVGQDPRFVTLDELSHHRGCGLARHRSWCQTGASLEARIEVSEFAAVGDRDHLDEVDGHDAGDVRYQHVT